MIRKILIPLNESQLSESAIPCALDFADRFELETILMEVTPHFVGVAPGLLPMTGRQMQVAQVNRAGTYLQRQAEKWGPRRVSTETPVGLPAEQICELAFQKGCDLIVMASHGRDHFPRWLLGSVAEGVLRQAHCPILLLRSPALQTSLFHKIVVPTDGSESSLAFLPDLRNFLAPNGTVTLLLSTGTSLAPPPQGLGAHFRAVEAGLRLLERDGQPYPVVVLGGDPVHDILDWCDSNSPDLIAMSTHGRSGFRRFLLGSVTEKVARQAPFPMLVYPRFRPRQTGSGNRLPS